MRRESRRHHRRQGFTLIELAIVLLIIGLIVAFLLAASFEATEQARKRATQATISKLEVGLSERLEAVLSSGVTANGAHRFLASINPTGIPPGTNPMPWGLQSDQRAQVIARLDQVKAEMPDVFFIDPGFPANNPTGVPNSYPLNFAALPYFQDLPIPQNATPSLDNFVLPLGHAVPRGYTPPSAQIGPPYLAGTLDPDGNGLPNIGAGSSIGSNPAGPPFFLASGPGTGIMGASYRAAGALYKVIGCTPSGYDAVDNNQNGLVDEIGEGLSNPDGSTNAQAVAAVTQFLSNHLHVTARSEMLYALLVEGQGPLGSVFSREDFNSNEVGDTDNDGAPEFLDGWGRPLQFYRWPIYHQSGSQKGARLYSDFNEPRQVNPLDPNRQLVTLAWWGDLNNPPNMSAKSALVHNYFTSLRDALRLPDPRFFENLEFLPEDTAVPLSSSSVGRMWERSANPSNPPYFNERAYFSRFLITSGGPDRAYGKFILTDAVIKGQPATVTAADLLMGRPRPAPFFPVDSSSYQPAENWAMQFPANPYNNQWLAANVPPTDPRLQPTDIDLAAQDDIDNQGIQHKGGGIQ